MNNKDTGFLGENIAADYLISKGFTIIERNWRYKHLEIDIIAHHAGLLHIVEVKTRSSIQFGYPEQQVSPYKLKLLKNAAAMYQYQYPIWKYIQFDIIAIHKKLHENWEILFFEDVFF